MVDHVSNRTNTVSPAQFGRRLREQRERHKITIEAIAASTKIKGSLLAGLERGDIAEWPAGIFQRGFVREYARAIGLPPEPVVAEFLRVFGMTAEGENQPDAELRLTLAVEPEPGSPVYAQAAAALGEAAGIAALAALISWIAAVGFGTMCGACAFLYYPLATAWLGCTPASWCLKRNTAARHLGAGRTLPPPAERRERLYLVKPASDPALPSAENGSADADSEALECRSAMR